MWFSMSDFGDLSVAGKLALPSFLKFWPCIEACLGPRDMIQRIKAVGVLPMPEGHFLIEIPA
jgi:hypothetical protein